MAGMCEAVLAVEIDESGSEDKISIVSHDNFIWGINSRMEDRCWIDGCIERKERKESTEGAFSACSGRRMCKNWLKQDEGNVRIAFVVCSSV